MTDKKGVGKIRWLRNHVFMCLGFSLQQAQAKVSENKTRTEE